MKKKAILRGLLGAPFGVFICYIITIVTSLIFAGGYYSPCVPMLVDEMGSEIGAVIMQAVLSGLLGASFAASSVIWENENWSLIKQTGIYFLISSFAMLPIAYYAHWMERTVTGFTIYFGIFITLFLIFWLLQYCFWKSRIKSMNEELEKKQI